MSAYETIFHPTDLDPDAHNAFAHALRLAYASRALLSVLHVGSLKRGARWDAFPHARPVLTRWGLLKTRATMKDLKELGLSIHKVELGELDPARATAAYIASHRPQLVVLSTHRRRGLDRLLHASIAEEIARGARATTLFVPRDVRGFVRAETGEVNLRHILVPLKPGMAPLRAVEEAARIGRALDCRKLLFTLLHVGGAAGMPRVQPPCLHDWGVKRLIVKGNVEEEILKAARLLRVDLITLATRGHDGFLDAIRGNTTERVLHEAPCPVLAVPVRSLA